MLNVIEVLEKDHRKVEKLFETLETKKATSAQKMVFQELADELDRHAMAEEKAVYPKAERMEETQDIASHSYEEHAGVRKMLHEMDSMDPEDKNWMKKVKELKETVTHHVEEEEGELFPKMEKLFTSDQLQEMAKEVEEIKHQIAKAS